MNRFQSVTVIFALIICTTNLHISMATQGNFATACAGGRSSVFDESFVTVADDASTLYWNPAGIPRLRNKYNSILSHTSPFSNLFGFWGIQHNFLSFVFCNKSWGVGASLDTLRTDKIIESTKSSEIISTNLAYSELKTSASLGKELRRMVSLGATFNYYKIQDIDDFGVDNLGLDVGILIPIRNSFRVGAVVRNISTLDYMPRRYSVGFALQPSKTLRLANAYSMSERVHKLASAVEFYWDWDEIALKLYSGLEYYPSKSDNFVWKLGGKIINWGSPPSLSNLGLNYSFEQHRFLQYSHRVTLDFGYSSLEVKKLVDKAHNEVLNPKKAEQILIGAVKIDPSYPATYYVAGLASECSGDFAGAKRCYEEAAKLNDYKLLEYKDRPINLQQKANSDHLTTLSEAQKDRQPGIYEKLKKASGQDK